MQNIKTNEYVIEELKEVFENSNIEEVKKIISIHKNNNKLSRDFIIKNSAYTPDEKIMYLDILDTLNNVNIGKTIKTTNFNGKVYTLMFIKEFNSFLRSPENNFTARELKVLLSIYEIITDANAISNCLISVNKHYICELAGIGTTNFSPVMKSLNKKNILKVDKYGSIYLNCEYFFMGNSMNYDLYRHTYENLEV